MRVIDLSIPIDAATPFYPGDPEPRVSPVASAARPGFNVGRLELGTHSGTHCDAPYHFLDTGLRIHELPLERFVGPGVLVDLVGIEAREPIGWDMLAPHEGELEPSAIVLLFTGWASRRHHPTYFDHPYLDGDACARLLSLGIRTIGIDALSLDETPGDGPDRVAFACHEAIARAGGVIVENLANLGALRGHARPLVSCLPLSVPGADAAPTRAVALLED